MRRRGGFTLVECLVVVAVIALLVALLIPAVQAARAASQRAACLDHLRQIGLAIQNHQTATGRYPSSARPTRSRTGQLEAEPGPFSLFAQILGGLDQTPLLNAQNFADDHISDRQSIVASALAPANDTVREVVLGVLLCPADGGSLLPGNSYRACVGAQPFQAESSLTHGGDGAFPILLFLAPADFRDGTSQTVAVAERLQGSDGSTLNPTRDLRSMSAVYRTGVPYDADQLTTLCSEVDPESPIFTQSGRFWMIGGYNNTLYNHVYPPNAPIADCVYDRIHQGFDPSGAAIAARSHHAGGVQVLMMDGSTRFVTTGIRLPVWRALATRAGGEPIASSEF